MAKLFCSELAMRATTKAVQIFGGYGYTADYPVERMMRDAKVCEIGEGTSEIQRIVISSALGAADGGPPMHVELEPSGGPFNRLFGRGTPARGQIASAALSMRDRVPAPAMRMVMKVLAPPRR